MKRIFIVALMVALLVATALPAMAAVPFGPGNDQRPQPASETASCVGQGVSHLNYTGFPGLGGLRAAVEAPLSGIATQPRPCV